MVQLVAAWLNEAFLDEKSGNAAPHGNSFAETKRVANDTRGATKAFVANFIWRKVKSTTHKRSQFLIGFLTKLTSVFREQIFDPRALGGVEDGFARAALERRLQAKQKKLLNDFGLCNDRGLDAAAAAPGVLHREMKGR